MCTVSPSFNCACLCCWLTARACAWHQYFWKKVKMSISATDISMSHQTTSREQSMWGVATCVIWGHGDVCSSLTRLSNICSKFRETTTFVHACKGRIQHFFDIAVGHSTSRYNWDPCGWHHTIVWDEEYCRVRLDGSQMLVRAGEDF